MIPDGQHKRNTPALSNQCFDSNYKTGANNQTCAIARNWLKEPAWITIYERDLSQRFHWIPIETSGSTCFNGDPLELLFYITRDLHSVESHDAWIGVRIAATRRISVND